MRKRTPRVKLKLNVRYIANGEPAVEQLTLATSNTALLLVDVYDGIQGDENIEGITGIKQVLWNQTVSRLAAALNAARRINLPVIYAINSSPRIGLEHSEFGEHFRRSWSGDITRSFREGGVDSREYHGGRAGPLTIPSDLAPRAGDYYIRKHVYSAFFDTRLDTLLRNLGVRTLIVGGFWASVCMAATSLDALYRNYRVIWLRDGTLDDEEPGQETNLVNTAATIRWFENVIGYTIETEEFSDACYALATLVVAAGTTRDEAAAA